MPAAKIVLPRHDRDATPVRSEQHAYQAPHSDNTN